MDSSIGQFKIQNTVTRIKEVGKEVKRRGVGLRRREGREVVVEWWSGGGGEEERLERKFVGDGMGWDGLISSMLVRVVRTRTYSRTEGGKGGC